jgi:hypothetical protein
MDTNCTSVAIGGFSNSREIFRMHHLLSEIRAAVFRRNRDGDEILLSV